MYATNYFEDKILNLFNGTSITAATTLWVALYTSSPTDTGTAGTEVYYPEYTRMEVTFGTPYEDTNGNMAIVSNADILFPRSSANGGDVRYIGILDSAVVGTGNMWAYGDITEVLPIRPNQQPSIYTGDLVYYCLGDFSKYLKAVILNVLRLTNADGFTAYMALFNGSPDGTGSELAGTNYGRLAMAFGSPAQQAGGQSMIANTARVAYQPPLTSWGFWTHTALFDSLTGGNCVAIKSTGESQEIKKSYVVTVDIGEFKIGMD